MNASWVAFAAENGLPRLTFESVKGRVLWDYISDATSCHFYKALAKKVRETGRTLTVLFRCDGPECRRFMKMFIVNMDAGALEFCSVMLREEARPRVDFLDPNFPRTKEFLTMCAWCKKVNVAGWVDVEEAVRQLQLFERTHLPQITHGVCPACKEAIDAA